MASYRFGKFPKKKLGCNQTQQRINRISYEISRETGRCREEKVDRALAWLRAHGVIDAFWKAEWWEEKRGIDFVIVIKNFTKQIPLQVKGSQIGADQHHMRYGYDIPVLLVAGHETVEAVASKIKRLLNL